MRGLLLTLACALAVVGCGGSSVGGGEAPERVSGAGAPGAGVASVTLDPDPPAGTGGNGSAAGVGSGGHGSGGSRASHRGGAGGTRSQDAGSTGEEAGAAGTTGSDGGSAGEAMGGTGSGGEAGSTEPTGCDCDAAHDCISGTCVLKHECNCVELNIGCSPLSAAMGDDFACPIDVQCGPCETGQLCTVADVGKTHARRCLTPTPNVSCSPAASTEPQLGQAACAPEAGDPPECTEAYALCSPIAVPATGALCHNSPVVVPDNPGANWFCGPPI